MTEQPQQLKRILTFPLLVLYGLGTVVGVGIYTVVGEIAGTVGILTPLSFLIAGILAAFTAMSLAELSARYPESAGEAAYVWQAFHRKKLSLLTGFLVIFSGIVSAATIARGAVGYVSDLSPMSDTVIIIGIVTLLGLIASLGIRSSAGIAATISVIEIAGLLLIIVTGWDKLGSLPTLYTAESASFPSSIAVFSGALLAFFAFIGFEDMVNMAEEVKDPVRVMPRAILTVLVLSSILYLVLSLVMVAAVDIETLKKSKVPLATVFEQTSGLSGRIISAIGILAILNGGLVQIIMAARVLYGLAKRGSLPIIFARVNRHTHTPMLATVIIALIVMTLALIGSLGRLATLTSLLMLIVFALINAALIRIKHTTTPPEGAPNYPIIIPWLGALTSIAFILWRLATFAFH